MFGVSIRQQRATAVGNATDEWTAAPAWSAISESTLEPRRIPTPLQRLSMRFSAEINMFPSWENGTCYA